MRKTAAAVLSLVLALGLAGCDAATCPVAWSAAQGGEVGPVVVGSGDLYFTIGVDHFSDGRLRKLTSGSS